MNNIDKRSLSGSERDLADMLDECLKEGTISTAIKALSMASEDFPLRREYLIAIGNMIIPDPVPVETLNAMEETVSFDSLN